MTNLNKLGINPQAISSVLLRCTDIIQEMRDFAEEIGCDEVVSDLDDLDFDSKVLEHFKGNLEGKNITDAVIDSCFVVTKSALEEASNSMDCGLTFESVADGEYSQLTYTHDGSSVPAYKGVDCEYKKAGDMGNFLDEALSFWLYEAVYGEVAKHEGLGEDWDELELRSDIAECLYAGYYDKDEIAACLRGEMIGNFKELVDDVVTAHTVSEPTTKHTKNEPSLD